MPPFTTPISTPEPLRFPAWLESLVAADIQWTYLINGNWSLEKAYQTARMVCGD
jgi:hypothetical protein